VSFRTEQQPPVGLFVAGSRKPAFGDQPLHKRDGDTEDGIGFTNGPPAVEHTHS
jgi:hypothetical protein